MKDHTDADTSSLSRRKLMTGLGAGAAAGLAGCTSLTGGGGGGGKQDLDFWVFGGIPAERTYIKDHYDAYDEHNVAYTHKKWGQKFQIVASAKANNSLPDVMAGQELLIPDYAEINGIKPLDDYSDRLSDINDRFIQANIDAMKYKNLMGEGQTRQWGLPGPYADLGAFIDIRTDYMEQAGFDKPPRTWDELLEYGKAFQDLDAVDNAIVAPGTDFGLTTGYFIGFVYQNGGRYYDPESMEATINDPGFVGAVELYQRIAEAGLFPDAVAEMNHIDAGSQLVEGKAAIFITFSHANAVYNTVDAPQEFQNGKGHIVTRAPLPGSVDGNFDQKTLLLQNAQGHMLATGNEDGSAEEEAAFDYMAWWNQEEQLAPWTYKPEADVGIRGRVPTLKSAFEDPYPLMEQQFGDLLTLYDQDKLFQKSSRFPSFSGLDAIQSEINRNVLQPVMLGNKTAQEACDAAQSNVQDIIDNKLKG